MADNTTVLPSPDAAAITIATDDVGGVHYPVYKLAQGPADSATLVDSNNPLFVSNFYAEVAKGNVTGHRMVHKFGYNSAVANGSWTPVSQVGSFGLLSAATTVRIKAGGNAADDSAGAGARQVTVQGIDTNGDEVTEAITTNGASASVATTTSFWRVHRAWVSSAGTYATTSAGANTGDVTIENSAGGTDLITILAGEGQTQYAAYTIPTGETAHLVSIHVTVDSNKSAHVRVYQRASITDTTAPMPAKRLKKRFDNIAGSFQYAPISPEGTISGLSDIWVEAYGDGAACAVSCDFELLIIAD